MKRKREEIVRRVSKPILAGLAGVAASGEPLVGGIALVAQAGQDVLDSRLSDVDDVLKNAGVTAADIADAIRDRELVFDLLREVATGASRTELHARRVALGRSLVRGLLANDIAEIRDELRLVEVLQAVDLPEVLVLDRMCMFVPDTTELANKIAVSRAELLRGTPTLSTIIDSVIARLVRLGLVADGTGGSLGGGQAVPRAAPLAVIQITEFGVRVLQDLREAGLKENDLKAAHTEGAT